MTINTTTRRAAAIRPLLTSHVRRYWPALALGSLLAVLEVAARLAAPWPLGWLVDHALSGPPKGSAAIRDDLMFAVVCLAVIVSTGAIIGYWSTRLLSSSGLHVANDMLARSFTHLQRLSLG